MIIVQLLGGLGNQMFQYAAGRSLAIHLDTELKLDASQFDKTKTITPRRYSLASFAVRETFASTQDLLRVRMPSSRLHNFLVGAYCAFSGRPVLAYKKEPHFHFDPDFFSTPDDAYLEGYWQSPRYFEKHADIIRKEFSLRHSPGAQNDLMAEKIRQSEAVSIHIRRGDYISDPMTFQHHGVCPLDYYHFAIRLIREKCLDPHFYIFSDDSDWVQQNLMMEVPHTYVTHNQNTNDAADLWLMSLCQHHIIANSSFSWWGAWLSDYKEKMIIAPKKWVNDETLDTSDLIPPSWYSI